MQVVADLVLEVHGATVVAAGTGSDVVVRCSDPAVLVASVPYGRRSLGRSADALVAAGLLVTVVGPAGTIVELGRGTDSRLGRLVTGSRAVRPGSWSATRPLAAASVRRAASSLRSAARRRTTGS